MLMLSVASQPMNSVVGTNSQGHRAVRCIHTTLLVYEDACASTYVHAYSSTLYLLTWCAGSVPVLVFSLSQATGRRRKHRCRSPNISWSHSCERMGQGGILNQETNWASFYINVGALLLNYSAGFLRYQCFSCAKSERVHR